MPLYEYECEAGHRFELIRKFSDPPLENCPTCGAAVHKLISSPAFQFKGTGWYITDYAKKDSPGAAGDSKADASGKDANKNEKADKAAEKSEKAEKSGKSDAKAESTGDSKSDAKTESKKSDSKPETKTATSDAKPAAPAKPST